MSTSEKGVFLNNSWYVAASEHEIGRTPFARKILNRPVVLYRCEDGTPVALEDRCCHRQLPLSMGEVAGDDLICGYHGLRYNSSGLCIGVPGQSAPPPGARVRSYPLLERFGWIFIWMGDPERADERLLPNWWWAAHPEWKRSDLHLIDVACNYQLINDNLLDVTHLSFVHKGSIGNAAIVDFAAEIEREDRMVRMTRWIMGRPPPPMYKAAGRFAENVDRAQIVEFVPPCFTVNYAICKEAGSGLNDDDGRIRIDHMSLSAPTPETPSTSHYFFTFVRGYGLDDPALDHIFEDGFLDVFREDVAVLEAQQRNYDLDVEQVNIAVDAAPMAARRLVGELITAEAISAGNAASNPSTFPVRTPTESA